MLGDMAGDADGIGFLKRVGADQASRHLTGDDHHRDRIHQRIGDAGNRVGRAGTGCDEHDAGFAGRAGIALRRMGRCLFVADEDVADALLFEQRVVDREHRAAGIAEHDLHTEVAQRLDQDVCSAFLGHGVLLSHTQYQNWRGAPNRIKTARQPL